MVREKNKVMLFISFGTLILSLLVHWLSPRIMNHSGHDTANSVLQARLLTNLETVFTVLPAVFAVMAAILLLMDATHRFLPALNSLSLTFSSMSIIAGGQGMVEYHFSIFMVLAFIFYYDNISLILACTVLFAIHHLTGYLWYPEIVYGSSQYGFTMVMLHLLFVILFIGAVIYQTAMQRSTLRHIKLEQSQKLNQTINRIIQSFSESSDQVLSNARKLTSHSNELNIHTSNVLSKMDTLNHVVKQQVDGAETGKLAMEAIFRDIGTIAETSMQVSAFSSEVEADAKMGNVAISETIQRMNEMHKALEQSGANIKRLNERSEQITEIVSMITEITSRTNLLALNATIEAARAGEHGKGFGIVSGEIRKLAEQTDQSAARIAALSADIATSNGLSIASMEQLKLDFKQGQNAMAEAAAIFLRILESVYTMAGEIRQISDSAAQLAASSKQMLAAMEKSHSVTAMLPDITLAVTGNSKEQHRLISGSSELAEVLEQLSERLNETIFLTRKSFSQ